MLTSYSYGKNIDADDTNVLYRTNSNLENIKMKVMPIPTILFIDNSNYNIIGDRFYWLLPNDV